MKVGGIKLCIGALQLSTMLLYSMSSTALGDGLGGGCDFETGVRVFRQCAICHTTTPDGLHSIGPNLSGVFGRRIATAAGYGYSPALLGLSDGSWDEGSLNAWLTSPAKFAPGTRMAYSGLSAETDREAVVCYLRSLGQESGPVQHKP